MKNKCLTCEHYQYHKRTPDQYLKALILTIDLNKVISNLKAKAYELAKEILDLTTIMDLNSEISEESSILNKKVREEEYAACHRCG